MLFTLFVKCSTEKYTRGVSAVESILTLDRLRQSVAIKELEQSHGQALSMRKTVSVPNFSQVRTFIFHKNEFLSKDFSLFLLIEFHHSLC